MTASQGSARQGSAHHGSAHHGSAHHGSAPRDSASYDWPTPPEAWPESLRRDFAARAGNGQVGTRLVSETERVRVWLLSLAPGERIGFHTHVLDYFWTAVTGGRARSHYADGRVAEVTYAPGDTQHHRYAAGVFMIHDLENVGETELVFTTVEFLDSANPPLRLDRAA